MIVGADGVVGVGCLEKEGREMGWEVVMEMVRVEICLEWATEE